MEQAASTTEGVSDAPPGPWSVWTKRIGMGVLGLVVLAAAIGGFGPREGHGSAEGDGYRLFVDYPSITRAGQPAPLRIRVEHPGGFGDTVTLSLSRGLFDDMDFQNLFPNPSTEYGAGDRIRYEFDAPEGDVFEVHLDARTAPGQFGEVGDNSVALLDRGRTVAEVEFRTWRMP